MKPQQRASKDTRCRCCTCSGACNTTPVVNVAWTGRSLSGGSLPSPRHLHTSLLHSFWPWHITCFGQWDLDGSDGLQLPLTPWEAQHPTLGKTHPS